MSIERTAGILKVELNLGFSLKDSEKIVDYFAKEIDQEVFEKQRDVLEIAEIRIVKDLIGWLGVEETRELNAKEIIERVKDALYYLKDSYGLLTHDERLNGVK